MARYNLTTPELNIITSFIFEDGGWVDFLTDSSGVSLRQARTAQPGLNMLTWWRTVEPSPFIEPLYWNEGGVTIWIRENDGVNINPSQRPPERTVWRPILESLNASIDDAFARLPEATRNGSLVKITSEDGSITTMQSGLHLVQQKNLYSKVLTVV